MKSMKQESNHRHISRQKVMKKTSSKIVKMMVTEKKLIEPGSHNLLIYNELRAFREIYGQYSSAFLPENEIIVIGTQYEAIDDVKRTLRLSGVDVEKYLNQGTLFIIDAQRGYQQTDSRGLWKLAMSLISRVKKEGRKGVTWFGDLGSFLSFEKVDELMEYELWCPRKYQDMMKTVCCYHSNDFEKLNKTQRQMLFDHHFKSILIV